MAGVGSDERGGRGCGGGNGGAAVAWAVVGDGERDGEQHAARGGAHGDHAGWVATVERCAERVREIGQLGSSEGRHVTIYGKAELHDR